ncbi:hypothetical protein CHLRE_12g507550v5 [Chlamydomonas reinhardtii]|uniref:Uncharacterized protein n=1 Tax=Chlamydomonas reinhardtii TaxID=3055 RepID=A0A2K3D2U2_CHLRE|nr:uncharacterized protein CHLRE_12g507550v5 [Chlamydomonas reinhardtii]XP_042918180.1 uncharacterized protein CHLRE_12g507550v5 [Chlamydomonas reinhardtii]PNW74844.1 hypothetical protein CHLRE_12g507550v5 [Chlamydomonas reinhardtii]PNW74845.1 hypothetical protein CHLRE_12g507550v5 [Chlamydomonas reinhardtii]
MRALQAQTKLRQPHAQCAGAAHIVVAKRHACVVQPARDVSARATKTISRDWDDLANAVPRANPEKRVLQDINFRELVERCTDWHQLQALEADLRERYDRQGGLAVAVVVRASELLDVEAAPAAEVRALRDMLAGSVAPFIANKGVLRFKPTVVPTLLSALAALQYSDPKLNDALLKLLESGVEQMMVQPVVSSAAAAAALGARLPPGLLDKLVARVDFAMRHLTAADVGDLATALAPYTRLPPSANAVFLSRLAAAAEPHLDAMSGEQLVDLLTLLVRGGGGVAGGLSAAWLGSYTAALTAALPGLTTPKSYAALLFALAKGSLAITEDFLQALLNRLAAPEPLPPAPAAARRRAGVTRTTSLLARMQPADLAVVAAVLSIYGYVPPGAAWADEYLGAVADRAADMQAQQVVTIVDACVELGLPLDGDTLDELLAVAEAGLDALPLPRLGQLAAALAAAGHSPDGPWLRAFTAALVAAAGRATRPELAEVAAVLPALAGAFPPEGPAITAVLEAIRSRAAAQQGLESGTCAAIAQSLTQLGMTAAAAAAYVDSLKPPPPAAAKPAPAAAPAAASPRATTARKGSDAAPAPAPAAPAAPVAPAAAASGKGRAAAAPKKVVEQEEEEEEDEYEDEEEEEEVVRPAARQVRAARPQQPEEEVVVSSTRASTRRQTAAPAAPPPPPPAAPADVDDGFVASTRARRRR